VSERSRAMLPIPDQSQVGLTTYDAKDPRNQLPANRATVPSRRRSERDGHLLDDIGFGASSAFGGRCHTPRAERLAERGPFGRNHLHDLTATPCRVDLCRPTTMWSPCFTSIDLHLHSQPTLTHERCAEGDAASSKNTDGRAATITQVRRARKHELAPATDEIDVSYVKDETRVSRSFRVPWSNLA
jgi:hypothetical protein